MKELLPYCASGNKYKHVYKTTQQWVVSKEHIIIYVPWLYLSRETQKQ